MENHFTKIILLVITITCNEGYMDAQTATYSDLFKFGWSAPVNKDNRKYVCPTGWTPRGYMCFKFEDIPMAWPDAAMACFNQGGQLARPNTFGMNTFVGKLTSGSKWDSYWLGLKIKDGDLTKAEWSDQTPTGIYVGSWAVDQPDVASGSCMMAHRDGVSYYPWSLAECVNKKPFTCEISACLNNEFLCRSRKCIKQDYICDGLDHCGDGSDENNCLDRCREYHRGSFGIISFTSQQYTNPDIQRCQWVIEAPLGKELVLEFTSFDTEADYDNVEVYVGANVIGSSRHVLTASGDGPETRVISQNNFMIVAFTKDGSTNGNGFSATYRTDTMLNTEKKLWKDPIGPVALDVRGGQTESTCVAECGNNQQCVMVVFDTSVPHCILYDTLATSFNDDADKITYLVTRIERPYNIGNKEIKPGKDPTGTVAFAVKEGLAALMCADECQNNEQSVMVVFDTVTSKCILYNRLATTFNDDADKITYLCTFVGNSLERIGGEVTAANTPQILTSPGYPNPYYINTRVYCLIKAQHEYNTITIHLDDINVEEMDTLNIHDGQNIASTLLYQNSKEYNDKLYVDSTGSQVLVSLEAKSFTPTRGFQLRYNTYSLDQCGDCYNSGTCISGVCYCVPGFTGLHCESEFDECNSNPCFDGAVCTDQIDGYYCECDTSKPLEARYTQTFSLTYSGTVVQSTRYSYDVDLQTRAEQTLSALRLSCYDYGDSPTITLESVVTTAGSSTMTAYIMFKYKNGGIDNIDACTEIVSDAMANIPTYAPVRKLRQIGPPGYPSFPLQDNIRTTVDSYVCPDGHVVKVVPGTTYRFCEPMKPVYIQKFELIYTGTAISSTYDAYANDFHLKAGQAISAIQALCDTDNQIDTGKSPMISLGHIIITAGSTTFTARMTLRYVDDGNDNIDVCTQLGKGAIEGILTISTASILRHLEPPGLSVFPLQGNTLTTFDDYVCHETLYNCETTIPSTIQQFELTYDGLVVQSTYDAYRGDAETRAQQAHIKLQLDCDNRIGARESPTITLDSVWTTAGSTDCLITITLKYTDDGNDNIALCAYLVKTAIEGVATLATVSILRELKPPAEEAFPLQDDVQTIVDVFECPEGYILQEGIGLTKSVCSPCVAGTYNFNGTCHPCGTQYTPNTGLAHCHECPVGRITYLGAPPGDYHCTGVRECLCEFNPCSNGGLCKVQGAGYTCECPLGYLGEHCEIDRDDCSADCGAGTCVDTIEGDQCICPTGYSGDGCEKELDRSYDFCLGHDNAETKRRDPLEVNSDEFSVNFWIQLKQVELPTKPFMTLYNEQTNTHTLEFRLTEVVTGARKVDYARDIKDGEWHMVTVVNIVSSIKVYTDTVFTSGIETIKTPLKTFIQIGPGWIGCISLVQMWGKKLDTSDLGSLFNARNQQVTDYGYTVGMLADWDISTYNRVPGITIHYPSQRGIPACGEGKSLANGLCTSDSTCISPEVLTCPSDVSVETENGRFVQANWDDGNMFEGANQIDKNYQSGDLFEFGEYPIVNNAWSAEDNRASCYFNVFVRLGTCQVPPNPINGQAPVCATSADGLYTQCAVKCKTGYSFIEPTPAVFTCGPIGSWDILNPFTSYNFPPCGPIGLTTNIDKRMIIFGWTWDGFANYEENTPNTAATDTANSLNSWNNAMNNLKLCVAPNCNDEFDVTAESDADENYVLTLTSTACVPEKINGNMPLEDAIREAVLTDKRFGLASIPGSMVVDSFHIDIKDCCLKNYQTVGDICVRCIPGTFYNEATRMCDKCPRGTYQTNAAATTCNVCKVGTTTERVGSSAASQCIDMCKPGYYFDIVEGVCEPCGLGFYQGLPGFTYCLPCGIGTTTRDINSTSVVQCLNYCGDGTEILPDGRCVICPVGTYRKSGKEIRCVMCPSGLTTVNKGAIIITDCSLTMCPSGQYRHSNTSCIACTAGTYRASDDPQSQCISCGDPTTYTTATCRFDDTGAISKQYCKLLTNTPQVYNSLPSVGPAAGGTSITVAGARLPTDLTITIRVGSRKCITTHQNSTAVIGITVGLGQSELTILESPQQIWLQFPDGTLLEVKSSFTFKGNPSVEEIHPKETIAIGGTEVTVSGNNFNAVAYPSMKTTAKLWTRLSQSPLMYNITIDTYETICQVESTQTMFCLTPTVDLPEGFKHLGRTKRSTHPNSTGQLSKIATGDRRKREAIRIETSPNGDRLEFYVGFQLDGVDDFRNFSAVDVFSTEPVFVLIGDIRSFELGERISFEGDDLDVGVTVNDYVINIGTDMCTEMDLLANLVSCYPPQNKPSTINGSNPAIFINIGKHIVHFAGYLDYGDDELIIAQYLHIIIPAAVSFLILITAIIVVVVCVLRRRKRMPTNKPIERNSSEQPENPNPTGKIYEEIPLDVGKNTSMSRTDVNKTYDEIQDTTKYQAMQPRRYAANPGHNYQGFAGGKYETIGNYSHKTAVDMHKVQGYANSNVQRHGGKNRENRYMKPVRGDRVIEPIRGRGYIVSTGEDGYLEPTRVGSYIEPVGDGYIEFQSMGQ